MNLSRWLIPRITYFPKTTLNYCKLIVVVNQLISVKSRNNVYSLIIVNYGAL